MFGAQVCKLILGVHVVDGDHALLCSYRVMNVRRSYLRIRFNTSWTNHVRACGEVWRTDKLRYVGPVQHILDQSRKGMWSGVGTSHYSE